MPAGNATPYDYSKSTAEVYGAKDARPTGPFAEARKGLDYTYHTPYLESRQSIQDQIVEHFLHLGSPRQDDDHSLASVTRAPESELAPDCPPMASLDPPPDQWIVFTAGPMGAGKSHTLRWLAKRGYFPLEHFILVRMR